MLTALALLLPCGLAAGHLFCDCRLGHHRDWTLPLHCTRQQSADSEVTCHKAEVPEIPQGYHYVPGYALVRLSRIYMPWQEAKRACEDEGAQLAVPTDRDAFDGLRQMFARFKGLVYANIGITDQVNEGVFLDIHGRPVSDLPWMPQQPNNGDGGNEDCVDFNRDGLSNDVYCHNPAPFFCERRLSVGVPYSYAWVDSASRFYKVHTERRAQAEAARLCRSENARLAVPDTWRRVEALLSLLEPNNVIYLVGLTDEAVEGDFVTETGRHLRDMEFQVWNPGEPRNNDGGEPENCLTLSDRGFYNDVRCNLQLPFICEILPV